MRPISRKTGVGDRGCILQTVLGKMTVYLTVEQLGHKMITVGDHTPGARPTPRGLFLQPQTRSRLEHVVHDIRVKLYWFVVGTFGYHK